MTRTCKYNLHEFYTWLNKYRFTLFIVDKEICKFYYSFADINFFLLRQFDTKGQIIKLAELETEWISKFQWNCKISSQRWRDCTLFSTSCSLQKFLRDSNQLIVNKLNSRHALAWITSNPLNKHFTRNHLMQIVNCSWWPDKSRALITA